MEVIDKRGKNRVEEVKKEEKVEKTIKCFVIAGGNNIISEYFEKCSDDGQDVELYWVIPMLADFMKLPTGQLGIAMSPLNTFSKDDVVGPINPFSILCSYEVDPKFIPAYESQVGKLKASRVGLVQARNMPKIGDNKMKIIKP